MTSTRQVLPPYRRDFLRALAVGAGMVLVPKAFDRFRWKATPAGLYIGDWITLEEPGSWDGLPVALYRGGQVLGRGVVVGSSPDNCTINIDWTPSSHGG